MIRRVLVALLAAVLLTACGSSPSAVSKSPADALASAKQHLDATAGVHLHITSSDVPSSETALVSGDGTLTRTPPAFQGTFTVTNIPMLGTATVDAIAVDNKVHVKVPVLGWQTVDPADYGIPDPSKYLDTSTGISSLIPATTGVTAGAQTRTGADNNVIVTEYSGTLSANAVAKLFPGVSKDFQVKYQIDGQGVLVGATLTGPFYGTSTSTYTITLDQYGVAPTITAP